MGISQLEDRRKTKDEGEVEIKKHYQEEMKMDVEVKELIGVFNQTYSHFKLTLHVYDCFATGKIRKEDGLLLGTYTSYLCPKLIDEYLNRF